ncbi:uncharacterized protein T551_01042 [Pneumocystis jirovecii RU7]|nr:uncharacterized protein T551_01042 [Pneumocystis jirovecii RU7]KTW31781.1 hypothetical protein T551_01042 [Pneumocystis jirovecii RU7]
MVKPELDGSIDYYGCLHVQPTATAEDIRQQYRKLALKYHPDRNPGNEAEYKQKFQLVNLAYQILSDTEKKRSYDRIRLILLANKTVQQKQDISPQGQPYFRTSFGSPFAAKYSQTQTKPSRPPGQPRSPQSAKSSPINKTKGASLYSKKGATMHPGYEHLFSKSTSAYSFFYRGNSPKFNPRKPSPSSSQPSEMPKKHDDSNPIDNDNVKKTSVPSKNMDPKKQSFEKENLKDAFKKDTQTHDEKASSKHTFFNIKSRDEQKNISCLQSRDDNAVNNKNVHAEKVFPEESSGLFSFSMNEKIFSDVEPLKRSTVFEKFPDNKLDESSFSFSSIPADLHFGKESCVNDDPELNDDKETRSSSLRGTLKQNKKKNTTRSLRNLSSQIETVFNPVFSAKIPDSWSSKNDIPKDNDSTQADNKHFDLKNMDSELFNTDSEKEPSLSSKASFITKNPSLSSKTIDSLMPNAHPKDIKKSIILNNASGTPDSAIATFEDKYKEKYGKKPENEFKSTFQKNTETDSTNSSLLSERVRKELESYRNSKLSHEAEKANKTNITKPVSGSFHVLEQLEGLALSSESSENSQNSAFPETCRNSFSWHSRLQTKAEKQIQELKDLSNVSNTLSNTKKTAKSLGLPDFPDPIIPPLSPSVPNYLTPSSFLLYLKEMVKYQQIWHTYSSAYTNFFQKWAEYRENCHQFDLLKDTEIYEMFLVVTEKEEKIREGWWSEEKRYRQALRDFLNIKRRYEHNEWSSIGTV